MCLHMSASTGRDMKTEPNDNEFLDFAVRPNRIHWPPLLYVATLAAAYGLQWLVPLQPVRLGAWQAIAGVVLLAAGTVSAGWAFSTFRSAGTPVNPTEAAKFLVVKGIYRITRNPMYLGVVLAFTGLGLVFGSVWLLVLVAPMAIGLHGLAILREERHLEVRFGEDYRTYKAATSRWIGPI